MTAHRPRVLAVLPGLFPSTIVNAAKPLMRLHADQAIDLDLSFQFVVRRRQIEQADVLVLCHTMDPAHAHILDAAKELRVPLIYDIDENLLEPPPGVQGLEFHAQPARQAAVRRCLEEAWLVRTYAPALKRYLEPYNANVVRVDGPVDWSLVGPAAPRRSDRIQIVYATSRVEDSIGHVLIAPLQQVLGDHPDVDVTIWGPRWPALDGRPRVRHRAFISDYDRYLSEFARVGFDIGLAPMPGDLFYQCKTATKFREYAACRIAGVYSNVEVYRDCVSHGETGLLVASTDEAWAAAIDRLITDVDLRRRLQDQGVASARERYAPGRIEAVWLGQIEDVARRRIDAPRRARASASAHGAPASPSALALAGGFIRQGFRYAARVPTIVRAGGLRALWPRMRGQVANVKQLVAWELALRRIHRQQAAKRAQ